jgi:hypothetical protein
MVRVVSMAAMCALAGLTGCAKSSVIPLAADTVQITAATARACGQTGAQEVAVRRAAVETIQRGLTSS